MAKPEWGTKRICHNCGARFYDLRHDPILCPKCGAEFDPEALLRSRRTRVAALAEPDPVEEPEVEAPGEEPVVGDDLVEEDAEAVTADGDAEAEAEESEEEEVLEDASELGEDQDDMAEVIDHVDEEEER
jgi:uncharacterized protein (TIGR02300 family)